MPAPRRRSPPRTPAAGLTARLTDSPATVDVAYRAMAILAGALEVPVSLVSLLTGLDVPTANNLVIAPSVSVTLYTVLVAVSVLKPWGRIGQRRPGPPGAGAAPRSRP
jgi:hypothetical protein